MINMKILLPGVCVQQKLKKFKRTNAGVVWSHLVHLFSRTKSMLTKPRACFVRSQLVSLLDNMSTRTIQPTKFKQQEYIEWCQFQKLVSKLLESPCELKSSTSRQEPVLWEEAHLANQPSQAKPIICLRKKKYKCEKVEAGKIILCRHHSMQPESPEHGEREGWVADRDRDKDGGFF